jgi:CRISPR-associated protein Cas1
MGKLQNQSNLLKYMAKYRKETDPPLHEELRLCAAEILDPLIEMERIRDYPEYQDGTASVNDLRMELMGLEGRAAQRYWSAVKLTLPGKYAFPGRTGRGAGIRSTQPELRLRRRTARSGRPCPGRA